MAIFGVPLAFSAGVAPTTMRPGQLSFGLDVSYLPKVDDATGTPTFCRPDKPGPENTDLLFAAPRPRLWLGLPAGFSLEGSWIPPVRMGEVKANLFGIALTRTTAFARWVLEVRAHATLGNVEAPITCDDQALEDSASPCFGGTRSNDSFQPNVFGIAVAMARDLGPIRPYLGIGYNHLAPRFQVNFTNQFGATDRRRVVVDLDRAAVFGGATWAGTRRIDLSAEVYSAPTDAITARVLGRIRLKG